MTDVLNTAGLDEIAGWYRSETGLEPDTRAASRLLKIAGYLQANGKRLDEVRLVPNQDRAWNTRRNRSDAERLASCIGNTGQATRLTYWWIVPKEVQDDRSEDRSGKEKGSRRRQAAGGGDRKNKSAKRARAPRAARRS